MDADGLPLIGMGIDLTKVEAIPAKRTLAFMNHFIAHTVAFLNRFSIVCEEKLENVAVRLQRLETTMAILEGKLASIPGLENVTVAASSQQPAAQQQQQQLNGPQQQQVETASNTAAVTPAKAVNGENGSAAEEEGQSSATAAPPPATEVDPRYARYLQMIKMGVPLAAIRAKVISEGLDPAVLENPANIPRVAVATTPASPAPAAPAPAKAKPDDSDDSDFSDKAGGDSSSEESSSDFDD